MKKEIFNYIIIVLFLITLFSWFYISFKRNSIKTVRIVTSSVNPLKDTTTTTTPVEKKYNFIKIDRRYYYVSREKEIMIKNNNKKIYEIKYYPIIANSLNLLIVEGDTFATNKQYNIKEIVFKNEY